MAESFLHGVEVLDIDDGVRAISVASTSVIGITGTAPRADAAAFPLNTPVVVNSRTVAAKLLALPAGEDPILADGTLPSAIDSIFDQATATVVVIRVEAGETEEATLANVIGGTNSTTGAFEGVHALIAAEHVVGAKPRILVAPGFTHTRPEDSENPGAFLANPVVAELVGIADRLRAVIVADGPSTTDADAIAYAGDFGSKRVFAVDPRVQKLDAAGTVVSTWASPCVAGVIARVDNESGFWRSPSNHTINGIIGTERAIDFALGDVNSRANALNEANVATIIRQDGFRLWGNRTTVADAKWTFLCVVRTADIIADSLQAAHLWAVDRSITKNYATDVAEGVNAFLRELKFKGAILGGNCWIDPDLNSAASIASGQIYFNFDFTPAYPAERVTFRSHLVDNYVTEIF